MTRGQDNPDLQNIGKEEEKQKGKIRNVERSNDKLLRLGWSQYRLRS